jgi:hypothetical protein
MADPGIETLSDDELFKGYIRASKDAINHGTFAGEIDRRKFIALQKSGKVAGRIAVLTGMLIAVGLLQTIASYFHPISAVAPSRFSMTTSDGHVAVLDSQSGSIFFQQKDGWHEQQPQSGKEIIHKLYDGNSRDPLGIR